MSAPDDLIEAYVLGTLDEAEQAAFEARIATDNALAARVRALSGHFAVLDETAAPVAVSPDLWSRIAARLDESPARGETVPTSRPANDNGLGWTRWAAAAGMVVALGIGFLGGTVTRGPEPQPIVIAVLSDDAASPGAIVEAYGDNRVRIVPLELFTAGADQVFEVWTLPAAASGPVSLGTFPQATDIVLEGPDLPIPESGQLYEITLEPAGGSPIGRPTGPVLYLGRAQQPVV